jgi:putative transposase
MKRRHRVNVNGPGHGHALTFSCYHRFPFLKAERVCQWLAEAIDAARVELDFAVWAYVFMPDHVHLIVYPHHAVYDMAAIRRAIKGPVARKAIAHLEENSPEWLPRITRRRGDVTERLFWQSGGGYDSNITSSQSLLAMIDYIHANPVRKGLVIRGGDWKWSSAAWFESRRPIPLAVDSIPSNCFDVL